MQAAPSAACLTEEVDRLSDALAWRHWSGWPAPEGLLSAPPQGTATRRFCQDNNPTVNFRASTIPAATMEEIVANTRSGRALWAVTSPTIPAMRRMLFHQLSGLMRDKYERPEQVSSSGSFSPACHLLCR